MTYNTEKKIIEHLICNLLPNIIGNHKDKLIEEDINKLKEAKKVLRKLIRKIK